MLDPGPVEITGKGRTGQSNLAQTIEVLKVEAVGGLHAEQRGPKRLECDEGLVDIRRRDFARSFEDSINKVATQLADDFQHGGRIVRRVVVAIEDQGIQLRQGELL